MGTRVKGLTLLSRKPENSVWAKFLSAEKTHVDKHVCCKLDSQALHRKDARLHTYMHETWHMHLAIGLFSSLGFGLG